MSDEYKDIDIMGEQTDNQYLLALAIAKRVRKIRSGAPALVDVDNPKRKPFQTAMKEIARKKILFSMAEDNNST
ncbi:MAG: DNA-directed RNA polymerase subunit omega [Candidatus Aegiribacteria sp.]|nr:DNA-directed RNA polymerase subunit omega [Candidatus Aegiribacteria sp.]